MGGPTAGRSDPAQRGDAGAGTLGDSARGLAGLQPVAVERREAPTSPTLPSLYDQTHSLQATGRLGLLAAVDGAAPAVHDGAAAAGRARQLLQRLDGSGSRCSVRSAAPACLTFCS